MKLGRIFGLVGLGILIILLTPIIIFALALLGKGEISGPLLLIPLIVLFIFLAYKLIRYPKFYEKWKFTFSLLSWGVLTAIVVDIILANIVPKQYVYSDALGAAAFLMGLLFLAAAIQILFLITGFIIDLVRRKKK